MKQVFNIPMLIILISTGLIGCKKDHADAPAPVQDLNAHGGRNRAEVIFQVPGDARTGKVFFGNGDYKEFTVTDASAVQKVTVDELTEQEQTLRVVTMNNEGIVSDPRGVKVKVYGSKYESALKPRVWADQVTHSASSLEFQFNDALQDETGVRVVFTNLAGAKDSVLMASTQKSITVNNVDTTKDYYYYSVFKPEAEAIDDFYSPSLDLKTALMLDFKKGGWTIAATSSEDASNPAANIIDNNTGTSWRSQSGGTFPHWVVIDMGNAKFIDGFYYINYPGTGDGAKNIKFETSLDNTTWTAVLQTEVIESYLRQRLALPQTVAARYVRISVLGAVNAAATRTEFAEIDAYNIQNVSANNGYTKTTAVGLTNAKAPYTGDGSNPFPALGAFRMQKVAGWTHSANAVVSYDDNGNAFSLFIAPVWGLGGVTNGKVHQTVTLQPGDYLLKIHAGGISGPAEAYGVASSGSSLPDYTTVASATNTLAYSKLTDNVNKTVEMLIVVKEATPVNIGVVYNLRDQYGATGTPWTSFNINGWELAKVE